MKEVSIDELISRFSAIPGFVEHLREARREVADFFYGPNDKSLRALRLRAGYSQEELAELAGISLEEYAALERAI